MKEIIKKIIFYMQLFFLIISYQISKLFFKKKEGVSWVIGVDEIAANIYFLKKILLNSVSVVLIEDKFYNFNYDYFISIKNKYLCLLYRLFYGPILLGFLSGTHSHFWYVSSTGFLLDRDYEFKFLKSKNKKIVCMFVGSDIRSPKLSLEYACRNNIDTYVSYMTLRNDVLLMNKYEEEKKAIAKSADRYADLIFSLPIAQRSYLVSKQFSPFYMFDENCFTIREDKHLILNNIKIVHAPSNPIIKGTPLVRASIKKLQLEGYHFEYVEIQNEKNKVVLEHLKTAHIVLDQFYAFVPGLFSIEAMANHCALLQSADPSIETALPKDSEDAWLITKYWQVYDNLKYLLDNPKKIKYYADKGYEFVCRYCTYEATKEYVDNILEENGVL